MICINMLLVDDLVLEPVQLYVCSSAHNVVMKLMSYISRKG